MVDGAVIYDTTTMTMLMIVVPDSSTELLDPSYNQPGTAQFTVPASVFDGLDTKNYYAATAVYLQGLDPPSGIVLPQ